MKDLVTATFLTMILCSPVLSFAQYGAPGTSTWTTNGQAANPTANIMITGTVVSIDQNMNTVTVNDSLTGKDRIFAISKKDDLENLKAGDKVTVTLQKEDSTKATNIIKQ